jgi:Stress up-regulated Nod 19
LTIVRLRGRPLLACSAAFSCLLVWPAGAVAGEKVLTFVTDPITVPGYGVSQATQLVDSPREDGYVIGVSAEVIDEAGNVQEDDEIMLHHVVIGRIGVRDYTCPGLPAERFYAEGEERTRLVLPPGFGYPNRGTDRWGLLYMLMNHRKATLKGRVRYTVRYVTGEELTPVKPVWLDIENCGSSEFDVPGTGRRGSTYRRTTDFVMPESGTFVAGGGHLHGGGVRLELRNETCRTIPFTSLPTWGGPEPKPLLHEPGPAKMSSFVSPLGIPVAAGDRLRLAAVYDNGRLHTRAMGIMVLFLVPSAATGCKPTPTLTVDLGTPAAPPAISIPFPRPPSGRLVRNPSSTWVGDFRYGYERVSLRRNTTFTWRFVGSVEHDVTVIGGPIGFSSPRTSRGTFRHRFTRPGTYRIFCSLHPSRMVQRVTVRR